MKRLAMIGSLWLFTATAANADIGLLSVDRTVARPGNRVVARFGGYAAQWPRMPLYLVASRKVPPRHECRLRPKGPEGSCEPFAARPPMSAPFNWLGRVHFAAPTSGRFAFRVPNVSAGAYRFVLYCAPCYRGLGGSLIALGPTFTIR